MHRAFPVASGALRTAGFQDPGQHRQRGQEETSAVLRVGDQWDHIIKLTHKLFDTYGLDLNHPKWGLLPPKTGSQDQSLLNATNPWWPHYLFLKKQQFFFLLFLLAPSVCWEGGLQNPLIHFSATPRQAPKTTAASSTPALFKASIPAWSEPCWVFDGLGVGWLLNDVFLCVFLSYVRCFL